MTETRQSGTAVEIMKSEGKKLVLDQNVLESVLLHPNIGKRKIALIGIAGELRKGKSFIMNFFVRYLRNKGYENPNNPQWMGDLNTPLEDGFPWRDGVDRHTTGILMWSEPFIMNQDGEEIAVLLFDTQGNLDNQSGKKEETNVFAISLLLSSTFIFNVSGQIQANHLENLQFCMEFTKMVNQFGEAFEPFQRLFFLVRDWIYLRQYKCGIEDGKKYLDDKILCSQTRNESDSMKSIRCGLRTTFSQTDCFLMPLPGTKAQVQSEEQTFTGMLEDIDEEFRRKIPCLADCLLHPGNIVIKLPSNAQTLLHYIIPCCNEIQSGKLPVPTTITQYMAESELMKAQMDGLEIYREEMSKINQKGFVKSEDFSKLSSQAEIKALETFREKAASYGDEELRDRRKTAFLSCLKQSYRKFEEMNNLLQNVQTKNLQELIESLVSQYKQKINQFLEELPLGEEERKISEELENWKQNILEKFERNGRTYAFEESVKIQQRMLKKELDKTFSSIGRQLHQKKEELELELLKVLAQCFEEYTRKTSKIVNDATGHVGHRQEMEMKIRDMMLREYKKLSPPKASNLMQKASQKKLERLLEEFWSQIEESFPSEPSKESEILSDFQRTGDLFIREVKNEIEIKEYEIQSLKKVVDEELFYIDEKELTTRNEDLRGKIVGGHEELLKKCCSSRTKKQEREEIQRNFLSRLDEGFSVSLDQNESKQASFLVDLNMLLSYLKIAYFEDMEKLIDGAYVVPDVLQEYHDDVVKTCLRDDSMLTSHKKRVEEELTKIFEDIKKWNEKNRPFFKRVIKSFKDLKKFFRNKKTPRRLVEFGGSIGAAVAPILLKGTVFAGAAAAGIGAVAGGGAVVASIALGYFGYCLYKELSKKGIKVYLSKKHKALEEEYEKMRLNNQTSNNSSFSPYLSFDDPSDFLPFFAMSNLEL